MEIAAIVTISLLVSALVLWWVFRKPKSPAYTHVAENHYGSTDFPPERPPLYRDPDGIYRRGYYNPGVIVVNNDPGFVDGMLMGEMMAAQQQNVPVVEERIVIENNVVTEEVPAFHGFSGGDSGGGGASSDWSTPDTSSSSYDSGSSYDSSSDSSSSYDSGSSGSDY